MHLKRSIGLMALSLGLVAAGPAAAQPGGGHGHGAHAGRGGGDVPSRVAKRVKRAERALDRASGYADDGNARRRPRGRSSRASRSRSTPIHRRPGPRRTGTI
jgi:hypothetical protein